MIVRYNVAEKPTSPGSETSYLLVVSLDAERPCVTDKITPGADQNDRARAVADADHACLPYRPSIVPDLGKPIRAAALGRHIEPVPHRIHQIFGNRTSVW